MTCYNMQGNTEAYAQWLDSKVVQLTSLSHQHTPPESPIRPTMSAHIKANEYEYKYIETHSETRVWKVTSVKQLTEDEVVECATESDLHVENDITRKTFQFGKGTVVVDYEGYRYNELVSSEVIGDTKDDDVSSLTDNEGDCVNCTSKKEMKEVCRNLGEAFTDSESEPDENGRSMSMANNPSFTPNKMKKLEDTASHACDP